MSFPEEPKTTKQKILEAGSSLLQSKDPIKSFKQHLTSLSFVSGEPNNQFVLHHFINAFNEDFAQALLYDGDRPESKLVGIQYIISDKVFTTLPEEEKKLWHSLRYSVRSGLLVAPSLPAMAEKPLMQRLLSSYGKSFLFWEPAAHQLPIGIPKLMMSFTDDGQANKSILSNLFQEADIKIEEIIKRREKMEETPGVLPGADAWQKGEVYQLTLQRVNPPQSGSSTGTSGLSSMTGTTGTTGTGTTGKTTAPGMAGATGTYGSSGSSGLNETIGKTDKSGHSTASTAAAATTAAALGGIGGAAASRHNTSSGNLSDKTSSTYDANSPRSGTTSTSPRTSSSPREGSNDKILRERERERERERDSSNFSSRDTASSTEPTKRSNESDLKEPLSSSVASGSGSISSPAAPPPSPSPSLGNNSSLQSELFEKTPTLDDQKTQIFIEKKVLTFTPESASSSSSASSTSSSLKTTTPSDLHAQ